MGIANLLILVIVSYLLFALSRGLVPLFVLVAYQPLPLVILLTADRQIRCFHGGIWRSLGSGTEHQHPTGRLPGGLRRLKRDQPPGIVLSKVALVNSTL